MLFFFGEFVRLSTSLSLKAKNREKKTSNKTLNKSKLQKQQPPEYSTE